MLEEQNKFNNEGEYSNDMTFIKILYIIYKNYI